MKQSVQRWAILAQRNDPFAAEREARIYLLGLAVHPEARALEAYVDEVGPVAAAEKVQAAAAPLPVMAEVTAGDRRHLVSRELVLARQVNARLVIPEDAEWPQQALARLAQPGLEPRRSGIPLGLWVRGRGNLNEALQCAVSVVGTHIPTGYGSEVASELGEELVDAGTTVVSGAGQGIESCVQFGALAAGGVTVAVVSCGLARRGGGADGALIDAIAESGVVVSEYPLDELPSHRNDLARQRLLACFGRGTVVVEAPFDGVEASVARTAAALGREAMAVPGDVRSEMSAGCNQLLRCGEAVAVSSATEVLGHEHRSPEDEPPF